MTVTSYEIPLEPASQTFQIALAGVTYSITLWWSSASSTWNINIADANGVPIISSIPLVTGVDLLGPFGYLDFGGQLVAQTDHNPTAPPTYDNLGTSGHLYFVVTTTTSVAAANYTNIYFGTSGTGGSGTGGGGGSGRTGFDPPSRGSGTA